MAYFVPAFNNLAYDLFHLRGFYAQGYNTDGAPFGIICRVRFGLFDGLRADLATGGVQKLTVKTQSSELTKNHSLVGRNLPSVRREGLL